MTYTHTLTMTEPMQEKLSAGVSMTALEVSGKLYPVETFVVIGEQVVFTLGEPA